MVILRRFLSFILSVVALGLVVLFLAIWSVRYWTTECEVSQVFKQTGSASLSAGTYFGSYNVAVTPLAGPNKMARICQAYTMTSVPYMDLLNQKVWLFPLEEYRFVYDETPQTRHWAFLPLGLGLLLLILAYLLFREKEERK